MGWYNSDGLYVKFGTEEATAGKVGGYRTAGPVQMVEVFLSDLTTLTSSAVILDYNAVMPKGARIEKIEVFVQTAATSGGSATLNLGLVRTDTTTNVSDTALINALALTSIDAAGETTSIVVGGTGAGSSLGTSLANNGYITAKYGTAAFTAGAVRIRIYYTKDLA